MAAENLELELRILSNLIYHKLNRMTMERESLTIHQCWILQHLADNPEKEIYQKDIERLFSIKRSTANQMLRTMESRGYIRRTVSDEDARRNILTVTGEGVTACENIMKNQQQLLLKLHEDIPESELELFQRTLRKLWSNIEQ